jgi:RNA polymerase sigma factor (sigma-70 family)
VPLSQSSSPAGDCPKVSAGEGREEAAGGEPNPLLSELVNGNPAAFWKLWEQHCKYLYGVCLKQMGGVHADAEDALSRAMITAWRRLPHHAGKIHDHMSLRGWLARLTHNLCVDIHRECRRNGGPPKSLEEFTPEKVEAAGGSAESPEESLLRREMEHYLRLMIARLKPNLRTPFILRFFHDVSYNDIASQLNLSPENVRKRIQQARGILQDRLSAYRAGLTGSAVWRADLERFEELFARLFPGGELFAGEERRERPRRTSTVRMVCVVLPSGVERSFDLLLDKDWAEAGEDEATTLYARAHPERWERRVALASLLQERGKWEEAVAELNQIIAGRPDLTEAHLRLGELLHLSGRSEEAVSVYEQALRAEKREPMRRHLYGLVEVCRGRYAQAASAFQQAALLEPHAPAHRHRLGLTHLRAGSYVEALEAFDDELRRNHDDIVALTFSHDALLAAGRSGEAVRRLRRAVKLDQKNVTALRRLIEHRLTSGAVAGAEGQETQHLLRMAERAAADAPEVRELLATYHVRRGEWEEGVSLLLALVAERPMCPAGWRSLAHALLRTGAYSHAADVIRKAHALHPADPGIQEAACEVLASARRPALRRILEEALALHTGRWSIWAAAGLALVNRSGDDALRGDADLACSVSSRAPRLRPQLADAWFQHGKVLTLAARYQEAVAVLTQGWKLLSDEACAPETLAAAVRLGESWRACGDERQARVWFETTLRRAPAPPTLTPAATHFWYGRALEALGDKASAVQSYSEALAAHILYPERQEALERLERLRAGAGPATERVRPNAGLREGRTPRASEGTTRRLPEGVEENHSQTIGAERLSRTGDKDCDGRAARGGGAGPGAEVPEKKR